MTPILITGNINKAEQMSKILGIKLTHQKLDLPEIQSLNIEEVLTAKAKAAFKIVNKTVMVIDTSLVISSLNGLPGPFVKFFYESLGNKKLCDLLSPFSDRSAIAVVGIGISNDRNTYCLVSKVPGKIAFEPSGDKGYGWDGIFIPDGYTQTYAEMEPQLKNTISMSGIDMKDLFSIINT